MPEAPLNKRPCRSTPPGVNTGMLLCLGWILSITSMDWGRLVGGMAPATGRTLYTQTRAVTWPLVVSVARLLLDELFRGALDQLKDTIYKVVAEKPGCRFGLDSP